PKWATGSSAAIEAVRFARHVWNHHNPAPSLAHWDRAHRDAFVEGKSICLCAMLSAESVGLPERVASAVKSFYDSSLNWLRDSFAGDPAAATRAEAVFAALQGGLLIAAVSRDGTHMERAAAGAEAMATAPMSRE
ncbi:MAG: hypothetical protein AAFU55_13155, partial [Pseudomonadota bacterium]